MVEPSSAAQAPTELRADLRLAFDVAELAAELALAHFTSGVSVTLKADGSPVTAADREVEHLLRQTLSHARPHDSFLGEEFGRVGDSDRIWILDPIDGTGFFSRGDPNWRIHIALAVGGSTDLAVVVAPALRCCWWATRGGGSFEAIWPRTQASTRSLRVSATTDLGDARLDALDADSRSRLPATEYRPPASPLPLVELVRGEIDAFLAERYYVWDLAPWILLVEEAGGRFTNRNGGNSGDQGGGLYSNSALHGRLLTVLGYPSSPDGRPEG